MGKKRIVNNTKSSHQNVSNPVRPEYRGNKLIFDFSYPNWLKGTTYKEFTNMLKNENEFSESMVHIFTKLIPVITENWEQHIKHGGSYQFKHCHVVAEDKIELLEKIVNIIHQKSLLDEESKNDFKYWQVGIQGGLRMYGVYHSNNNIMYPLFVDHHHLIHPSEYHNQKDVSKYAFCAVESYS